MISLELIAQRYSGVPPGRGLYLLGSMVMFMFIRTTVTAEIFHRIVPEHKPSRFGGLWPGSYADVLPYVRQAFDEALSAFSSHLSSFDLGKRPRQ
jgi:hypothetical protein